MSEQAYRRVAVRLRALDAMDRDWILQQLGGAHCQGISAALQGLRAAQFGDGGAPPVVGAWSAARGDEQARIVRGRLASVPGGEVLGAMAAQPDWTLAVVLAAESWPWAEQLWEQLGADRTRRVRSLSTELAPRVTVAVREAVLRWFVSKLDTHGASAVKRSAFERNLDWTLQSLGATGTRRAERI
jgi:hypothetical protein